MMVRVPLVHWVKKASPASHTPTGTCLCSDRSFHSTVACTRSFNEDLVAYSNNLVWHSSDDSSVRSDARCLYLFGEKAGSLANRNYRTRVCEVVVAERR